MISVSVRRALLDISLRRASPDRIPRSGDAGAAVNCYTTRVIRGDEDHSLIVQSADGGTCNCLEWDGNRYSINSKIKFTDLLEHNFELTHYHGLCTTTYSGFLDLALGRIFRLPYIKARSHSAYHRLAQGLYNRRKLVTKQRIDLLKVILSAQLNGRDKLSSLSVMSLIHSERWYLHPNHDNEHHRVQFYLDKLAETKDLVKNGIDYQISGQGVAAIELYEEQERKHGESISAQRRMFWLTIVIALLTLVQAGLVKLPSLLDFTSQ
ncbi:hypothetical protein QSH18_00910 [Xanthomonas sp. NCPPB 2654]|uniref:hypothetical protein n=1 Tax=unclassified Xanthomonas TaxID=2643310 RepID=UPI0021DFB757|nr:MULTISPECIES: hypothetical protein [unclassified Xanthomonas]MDL5364160.1 hypothetical protein [Xanthomonas sp. NCPPB 2654]UYC20850.1 hypothetical protein NUG20_00610 [Xanthomonas sp. CFBP 8443]